MLPEPLAEILAERRGGVAEGGPDGAVRRLGPQAAQAVLLGVEVRGHAALAPHATAERHAGQVALQVVHPLVVGAQQLLRVAEPRLAELHAAMGAAIFQHRHLVGAAADQDDRALTERRGLVVADAGDLGLEPHV